MRVPRIAGAPGADLLAAAALRCAVVGVVWQTGFCSVSDDDFARVALAQQFALSPALDPTGSSWLPFPFWVQGIVFRLLGTDFEIAQYTQLVLSAVSAGLVVLAAQWAGLSRPAALGAGLVSSLLPHVVLYSAAPIPEVMSSALALLALGSLSQQRNVVWGALALCCACLSRYEFWALAPVFLCAGFMAWRATRQWRTTLPYVLPTLAPALWLVHGALHHGDALFFLRRVADYRRASGAAPSDLLAQVLHYPRVLLSAEPELMFAALVLLASLFLLPAKPGTLRWSLTGCGALLLFLVLGDLGDGAPTHHPERTVLLCYLVAVLLIAERAETWWCARRQTRNGPTVLSGGANGAAVSTGAIRGVALMTGVAVLAGALLRPRLASPEGYTDRSAELETGHWLRFQVPSDAKVLVDTPDYGHLAIAVGWGRPGQLEPLISPDPRHASSQTNLERSAVGLVEGARRRGATHVLLTKPIDSGDLARVASLGETHGRVLLHLTP